MTWTDFMQRLFQRRQPTTAKVPPAELIHLHTRLYALGSETDADAIRDAMRHWDGYVREAALIRCTELGLVQLLPIVAERLNDWVPQIRHAARCAMLELLVAADAPLALGVLPDVQRLAGALREDHSAWIARFECALLEKIGARMLLDATRDAALKISRASFDLLARHRAVDARTLALAALHSRRDVALALRALDAFAPRAGEASPEARDIYLLAMRSSFGAVRARALPWLLSMSPGDVARQAVIDALLDSQSGTRIAAAAYLRNTGLDLRAHFRGLLVAGTLPARRLATALMSLADLRDVDDLPFIQGFTASPAAPLRRAGYLGWLRIAPHDKDDIALAMLRDDAWYIRSTAIRVMKMHGAYIPLDAGRGILLARGDISLLLSFVQSSKWDWLECLARLAGDAPADALVRQMLAASLVAWAKDAGARYEQPAARQAQYLSTTACRAALEALAGEHAWIGQQVAAELALLAAPGHRPDR